MSTPDYKPVDKMKTRPHGEKLPRVHSVTHEVDEKLKVDLKVFCKLTGTKIKWIVPKAIRTFIDDPPTFYADMIKRRKDGLK
ncbi:MAG: hypothetical protein HRT89_03305 [Lentisphaeria bacterium]|nr:hypothetical protein [Lentisphaeria bacterium]NQZ67078.1 hypothetical protein [Lentisphaeria bacterium]